MNVIYEEEVTSVAQYGLSREEYEEVDPMLEDEVESYMSRLSDISGEVTTSWYDRQTAALAEQRQVDAVEAGVERMLDRSAEARFGATEDEDDLPPF